MKILSKIKNINNKKVLYPNTKAFDLKKMFVIDMTDMLNYSGLLYKEYDDFLSEFNGENTSLDDFYDYYKKERVNKKPTREIIYKNRVIKEPGRELTYNEFEGNFFIMKKEYWSNILDEFLKDGLYKNKTEREFEDFLKKKNKKFLIKIYKKEGKKYFDLISIDFLEKNNYGLKNDDVDIWLDDLLGEGKTLDGSFLYKWQLKKDDGSIETSGIKLFNEAADSGEYMDLKKNEMKQWEYILDIISKDTYPEIYNKIKKIIGESKTIAELGPGEVDKLLQVLKAFYGDDKNKIKEHFSDKMTKFLDLEDHLYKPIEEQIIKEYFRKDKEKPKISSSTGDMKIAENSVYNNYNKASYFMFGGTIGNFTQEEIGEIFDNMNNKNPIESNNFFVSYFTEPKNKEELEKLKNIYRHNGFETSIMSGFEALGIPRKGLEYVVDYIPRTGNSPGIIKLGAKVVSNSDLEVVSPSGKIYKKKKGDFFRAINSARFGEDDLKTIAEKHNFDLIINTGDKEHKGVAVSVFESKGFLSNNKFKKPRGIISAVLISAMLLSGGLYYLQKFNQNSVQNKIKDHKKKTIDNKPLFYAEYLREIGSISQDLAEEFISIYGAKNLTYEIIRKEIALYLKDFSEGNSWLNEIKKAPNDLELKDMFLAHFVEKYFYEKMFENGFDNLEPEPFLKGMEKDMIETLQYNGPVREQYNEKDGLWYIIHAPRPIYSIMGSDNEKIGLVEGYIVPHKCEFVTIKVSEVGYDIGRIECDPNQIIISKTKPDNNGYIIIKKIILGQPLSNYPINGRSEIALKDLTENYKPTLFRLDNAKANNLREHKNLIVDKQIIIEYFEQKDPLFKKTWDLFKKLSKSEKYYMGKLYFPPEISQLEKEMIIDLYEDRPFGRNVISTFKNNDKKMIDYVGEFIRKHENILK